MRTFESGRIVATASVAARIENDPEFAAGASEALARHLAGDWGDLDPEDAKLNDEAMEDGGRILSVYHVKGDKIWIITEAADKEGRRSATTLLYPSEY